MRKEDLILRKIEELSKSMDAKFEGVDARFKSIDARFDSMDAKIDGVEARLEGQIDRLAVSFLEMQEKMDTLATNERVDGIINILDGHTAMLTRLDTERLASINRFERIERRIGM